MISAAYAGVRNAMDQGNALALHVKVMASEETILSDCTGNIDAVKVPCWQATWDLMIIYIRSWAVSQQWESTALFCSPIPGYVASFYGVDVVGI